MNSLPKQHETLDLVVVGGGINGVGIAVDAVGRGLKVGLYESHDFAGATSSVSTKLIHGGLRYLEHFEFRLVREALAEREILLAKAPHIISPMRFRLPHRPHLRPAWMIRAGLFLYDHLAKLNTLPKSQPVRLDNQNVVNQSLERGFEYSDCWVDDARLVVLNAMQAKELGAEVSNYCQVNQAKRVNHLWDISITDKRTQSSFTRKAKALVNATGPWVNHFVKKGLALPPAHSIRLIKGSHIIVPRLHTEEQAYILQGADHRIVFVIPYLGKFSMIGTTDVEFSGDPRSITIDNQEKQYLIDITNQYFRCNLSLENILDDFSGVRALRDDESDSPQAITRDYTLSLEHTNGQAPLLSVFGGKLTTYRKLSEAALNNLAPFFELKPSWTQFHPLPGGENFDHAALENHLQQFTFLDNDTRMRWLKAYGSRLFYLLDSVQTEQDLGIKFTHGVYQKEIDYLIEKEFSFHADDVLKRRSKLHLLCDTNASQRISDYIQSHKAVVSHQ